MSGGLNNTAKYKAVADYIARPKTFKRRIVLYRTK